MEKVPLSKLSDNMPVMVTIAGEETQISGTILDVSQLDENLVIVLETDKGIKHIPVSSLTSWQIAA